MKKLNISFAIFLILFSVVICNAQHEVKITSPNGKISVGFQLENGKPQYHVSFNGENFIKSSALGFTFLNQKSMVDNFSITHKEFSQYNEVWQPVWGSDKIIRNNYKQLKIKLEQTDRKLNLIFRVFNDGFAFRYEFPEQENLKEINITEEITEFNFAGDYDSWWIPGCYESYEYLYNSSKISDIDSANTPATFKVHSNLHFSIHEANLTDYAGMSLRKNPNSENSLVCGLVPWVGEKIKVKGTTPLKTPWRTIQMSEKSGGLIESHIIQNLNPPCVLEDVSWIKPMRYIGIWWGMHLRKNTWYIGPKHGATTENAIKFIDFAHKNNIHGVLIEGWNEDWKRDENGKRHFNFTKPYSDFDIEYLTKYAKEKNVEIIGHHENGADVVNYENQVEDGFKYYKKLGINSIKTGYVGTIVPDGQHHHGQWMVNHYRRIVELAAKYKITLDVHEPIKPTGISRTYPNMMTREGVRGMEWNAWSEGNPPEHTAILPFTRMLAGPLDYTPGIFDITFNKYHKENRVYTTLTKQLALYVILYSPLQMAADLIENYEGHEAFEFISNVPVSWDKTKVLDSEIGDFVTIARKKDDQWFVGSLTDENERSIKIDCDFLEEDIVYTATIYRDKKNSDWETNPMAYKIEKEKIKKNATLKIKLAAGGGVAIQITPEERQNDYKKNN